MEKAANFYVEYIYRPLSQSSCCSRIRKEDGSLRGSYFMQSELNNYKTISLSNDKPIKQYGFMKRFGVIAELMPFVSSGYRPEQLSLGLVEEMIEQIYQSCLTFLKMGWWKTESSQSILQQYVVYYLYHRYPEMESALRVGCNKFCKFLLSFFYTTNVLKTQNRHTRNFINFLNDSYSLGQLFLYICLRNIRIHKGQSVGVSCTVLKKIGIIFQQENESLSLSYSSMEAEGREQKMVNLEHIFEEPLQGSFHIPKFKLYKIMRMCEVTEAESDSVDWKTFLQRYFECLENTQEVLSFDHIVCAKLAQLTYALAEKLLGGQGAAENFLEEAFSYLFEILELVFSEEAPKLGNAASLENITNLRKHYAYMKSLNNYEMTMVNKFAKKLLKNSHILNLFKKNSICHS